ncbi:MAG: MATE family efflux transporter [Clostridium sp.]|nr:MATE family efflux transporter [Clostridium sp.]
MAFTASGKRKSLSGNRTSNLTEGSLWKGILFFGIPLIASNLLQILFNMSDIAVVGRFAGPIALGSVGSTSTLVVMITTFIIGIGSGINVIAAHALGKQDHSEVRRTVQTAFLLSIVIGFLTLCAGELIQGLILKLLQTKEELFDGSMLYLRIYFLGAPALAVYNFGSAIYSAAGNTRRPLMLLTASGILNVLLNLWFVIALNMDVAGVALASVIAQYCSAVFIVLSLLREKTEIRLDLTTLSYEKRIGALILPISLAAGLSNAIFQIANLFVQYGVNTFDAVVVAGNAAAQNADALDYDVMAAFYTAGSSFIGQNFGAGKMDRVRKAYLISTAYAFVVGTAVGLLLFVFGEPFLHLFTKDDAVAEAGIYRLSVMALSCGFSALMDNSIAACRGLGKSAVPTVIVLLGSCVFRIVWIFTVFAHFHTITSLYLLYIFSWALTGVAEMLYFGHAYRAAARSFANR